MMAPNKVRVAVSDGSEALKAVHADIEGAARCAVLPELQETERGSLIVEMRLMGQGARDSSDLARAIKRSNSDIEVLSCWRDGTSPERAASVPLHSVVPATTGELPDVARRALRDGVPTAAWLGSPFVRPGGRPSGWLLAVPLEAPDGGKVVGLSRRTGYSYRFASTDVEAIRSELVATAPKYDKDHRETRKQPERLDGSRGDPVGPGTGRPAAVGQRWVNWPAGSLDVAAGRPASDRGGEQ
jgi:hypothetical protein